MLQAPQEDAHQQCSQQAVETYQRIEHSRRDKHIDGTQIILLRQQTEDPHSANSQRCADGSGEEITSQLQIIDPIAQIHIHEDDGCERYQQYGRPPDRNAERAPDDQQKHRPPQREQGDTQGRVIEKLCEITAQPRQQPTRSHHLLFQKQRCIQKEIQLLHFPKEVALVDEQTTGNRQQRHHDQSRT